MFQVIPDWVNEVLPSSLHHTRMNQKKKIRWFDTQLETRENLPFRFSGYKPIIINPIKRFNSLNYLPSQGEAAEASEKVHIKCSSLCKKKEIMLYHPKNNFRYYSMRNLVKTFPFYIDLTTKKYLIFFLLVLNVL